jgi:ribosome-binding protein aMBF1 (putative translation factor)
MANRFKEQPNEAQLSFYKRTSEAVKSAMTEKGITQYRLAQMLMDVISLATIRNIIRGEQCCTMDSLVTICDTLGIEIVFKKKEETKDEKD